MPLFTVTVEHHHYFHPDTSQAAGNAAILAAITNLKETIMATSQEIADALNAAKTELTAATTQIEKIGTETQTLIDKVATLTDAVNNSTITPEVAEAVAAVAAQVGVLKAATQSVDDKVPDAPAPVPAADDTQG